MPTSFIREYGDLIDDHAAFVEALARPLNPCFWFNPIKASHPEAALQLLQESFAPEPFAWKTGAFRCRKSMQQIGHTIPFFCGWIYVQEEIAQTAVAALDPQPGECIADLCSSPGGKTAEIACRVGPSGTVLAVEPNPFRLAGLGNTIERLGLLNVCTFEHDGQSVPLWFGPFDRVLIDAPCSSEGTARKSGGTAMASQEGFKEQLALLQARILRRGLSLLKPGGTLVYSTCTINPLENEGVLTASLSEGDRIVPFEISGLRSEAGVHKWKTHSFRPDVAHARRYLPHHNDTGGFFVAKVLKTPHSAGPSEIPGQKWKQEEWLIPERVGKAKGRVLESLDPDNVTRVKGWFRDQFGEELQTGLRLFKKGGEQIWASTITPPKHPHFRSTGIPLVKLTARSAVPTSASAQLFGSARSPHVDLDQHEALTFAQGIPLPAPERPTSTFVLMRSDPFSLGYARKTSEGMLPQVPKGYKIHKGTDETVALDQS